MSRRRKPDEDSTVDEVEEHTKRLKKQHDVEQKATLDQKSAAKTVVKDGRSLFVYQGQSSPARSLAQRCAPLTLAEPCSCTSGGAPGSAGRHGWQQHPEPACASLHAPHVPGAA
jgi:hypothetical protein